MKEEIVIRGLREKNLKNINVRIPKNKITTVIGLSGAGKSALVFDTIAAEAQRQLNETYSSFIRNRLQHYGKPDVDSIENLSVSIVIDQKGIGDHARSTVGTYTDIYSLLRLLFSRAGEPFIGYSDAFSFNNSKGMCNRCQGLGFINTFQIDELLDKNKSLNEGAILFPTFYPGGVRWKRYVESGLFDNDKKICHYSEEEMDILLYKSGFKPPHPTKHFPPTSFYEGIIPRIQRTFLAKTSRDSKKYKQELDRIILKEICPDCHGSRLNKNVLKCRVNQKNIGECVNMTISQLLDFISSMKISQVQTIIDELIKLLSYAEEVGLGYLSLSRSTMTLSGGESQRLKMIKQLGSCLNGLIYIFDEPSTGLHTHDIQKINKLMLSLRNKGNTILVVEHDYEVIKISDHIIEIGPYSGKEGGKIVFEGTIKELCHVNTLTAQAFQSQKVLKEHVREPQGWLSLNNVSMYNICDLSIKIPKGIMTVITGVAGSGKSTLISRILPRYYPECMIINQKPIAANKRSIIATAMGIFDEIRDLFAKANQVSRSLFSYNARGACPNCKGLGFIELDLAFMDKTIEQCEVCHGKRYNDIALRYSYKNKNIAEVLDLSIDEAYTFFSKEDFLHELEKLIQVGLGYIKLGQSLSTLSGGERQRLKIASQLDFKNHIYILDEPTTGLHPYDIKRLLHVFDMLIEKGSTLLVIEHNLDCICAADWIIDLGVGAGIDGGNILFTGKPRDFLNCKESMTAYYFNQYVMHKI